MGKRAGATAGYGELSNTQKFEFLADVAARLLGHVIDADPQAGPKDPNLQTYPAYELGTTASTVRVYQDGKRKRWQLARNRGRC